MRIDHVIYAVADLDVAVRRFETELGLVARNGGEHPAWGTHNALVPLGSGQYLELLAVADPSSTHPIAATVTALTQVADRPIAVCLRPPSFDEVVGRLGIDVVDGSRKLPEGGLLEWRLAGVAAALGPSRLPFFIEWGTTGPPAAESDPSGAADEIAWVEVGNEEEAMETWCGTTTFPFRYVAADPGPQALGLRLGSRELVLR